MISRMHPVANWVRLAPHEHRKALDKVLDFRDAAPDPMASGMPEAAFAWFWESELPRLIQRPEVRRQAEEHLAELEQSAALVEQELKQQAPALLARLKELQAEVRRLEEVLNA